MLLCLLFVMFYFGGCNGGNIMANIANSIIDFLVEIIVKLTKLNLWIIMTDLARQSSCLCPADNEDRSRRAPRPPSLFINPSNLSQFCIIFCLSGAQFSLLCFFDCLQHLSVWAESHRIEILPECPGEEERILRDDYKLLPKLFKVEHPDVDGVNVDLACGHLRQPEEAVE